MTMDLSMVKDTNFEFALGDELEDKVTGFAGIVVCRSQWLNGCNTYGLKSQELQDGQPMEMQMFDEPQLELVEEGAMDSNRKTGGPCDKPRQPNRF